MPTIALIICTIFVFYMLRLDRKQSPEVSFAFWIPTIWFLVICSRPLGIWFQAGAKTIEEGSPLDRILLTVFLCLGLIMMAKRKFNWLNLLKENIWLVLLLGYSLLNCIWANDPSISLRRWIRDVIPIFMVATIASELHPLKALESLFRRSVYILIPLSYLCINYFPEYGRIYVHQSGDLMWIGVAMHKNTLTQLCVFAIIFLIWTFIRRHQGRNVAVSKHQTYFEVFIMLLSLWMMGGPYHMPAYSATAATVFIIGLILLTGFFFYKKPVTVQGAAILTALVIVIIIYGTITPFIGKLSIIDVSSMAGREQNLTGRAYVWQQLVPLAMQRSILGHGYAGFWTSNSREDFNISGAHNGYLDIILSSGFLGLVLYAIFIISNIRKAQRIMTQNFDWGVFWICYLVMALAANITESLFISFESRMMVVILCLTFATTTTASTQPEILPQNVQ